MRWILRLTFLLVIVALALGAFLVWFPAETVARIAADRFTAATGRKLTISGKVSATFWPVLGVSAEGVTLANTDWGSVGQSDRG